MTRADTLLVIEQIPEALRVLHQWEVFKLIDGVEVPINCRTGSICYGPGFGMPFAQALEFFLDHQHVVGLFLRILPTDDWRSLCRIGVEAGGRYGFTPFVSQIRTRRRSSVADSTGDLFQQSDGQAVRR